MTKKGDKTDSKEPNDKLKKKVDKRETVVKRSKLEIDIDDDKILGYHFEKMSLRQIAKKMKLSHATIKQRLDIILKKLKSHEDKNQLGKINFMISEHEHTKKRAWEFITKKEKMSFKYFEVIIKANQEISKLQALYPKEIGTGEKTKTFEELLDEMNARNNFINQLNKKNQDAQSES